MMVASSITCGTAPLFQQREREARGRAQGGQTCRTWSLWVGCQRCFPVWKSFYGLVKLLNGGLSVKLSGREVIELRAASVTTDSRGQSSEYCSTYLSMCSLRSVMGSPYFVLRGIVFFSEGPKSLLMPLYMMFPRSAASCISLQSLGK